MRNTHELVEACRQRDARAQRELYDLFKGKLMGICRRYARSREEAQDILQEVFIKIFTKITQIDSAERLENWMARIAVNTSINYYHQAKKNLYADIEHSDPDSGDYELLLSKLSDSFVVSLINQLPDGCRIVFNLFVVEGYNHAEIGKMLAIGESTSRSQLAYAKKLLKDKLNAVGILKYERFA